MFQLMKAQPECVDQITGLVLAACFWRDLFEGNILGLGAHDFAREWYVKPRLQHTWVLLDERKANKVCACLIALSAEQANNMPDYRPHLLKRVLNVFAPYFEYNIPAEALVSEVIAVDSSVRRHGLATILYDLVESLALAQHKCKLISHIPSFNTINLRNRLNRNFIITDIVSFPAPIKKNILRCELDLSRRPIAL